MQDIDITLINNKDSQKLIQTKKKYSQKPKRKIEATSEI